MTHDVLTAVCYHLNTILVTILATWHNYEENRWPFSNSQSTLIWKIHQYHLNWLSQKLVFLGPKLMFLFCIHCFWVQTMFINWDETKKGGKKAIANIYLYNQKHLEDICRSTYLNISLNENFKTFFSPLILRNYMPYSVICK